MHGYADGKAGGAVRSGVPCVGLCNVARLRRKYATPGAPAAGGGRRGVLGASAAELAASPAWAGDDKPKDPLADCGCKCVETCCDAMNWCNEAFLHCSKELAAGRAGRAKAMALLLDCGEVCSVAAKLVAREGALTAQVCRTCVEACALAAPECEKVDHPTMKDAKKSLKKCRDATRFAFEPYYLVRRQRSSTRESSTEGRR